MNIQIQGLKKSYIRVGDSKSKKDENKMKSLINELNDEYIKCVTQFNGLIEKVILKLIIIRKR